MVYITFIFILPFFYLAKMQSESSRRREQEIKKIFTFEFIQNAFYTFNFLFLVSIYYWCVLFILLSLTLNNFACITKNNNFVYSAIFSIIIFISNDKENTFHFPQIWSKYFLWKLFLFQLFSSLENLSYTEFLYVSMFDLINKLYQ